MSKFSTSTDADIIDHFVRKAHVERSLAFSSMTRLAIASVKDIFTEAEPVTPLRSGC